MTPINTQSMSGDETLEGTPSLMAVSADVPWSGSAFSGDPRRWRGALEPYRDFLMLVARRSVGPELAPKLDASDLVQDTFLAAQQYARTFRGNTEHEWRAWLKAVLLNCLANQRR